LWPSGLFIIDPEGNLKQATYNPMPIGRSVDETLRLVQALQARPLLRCFSSNSSAVPRQARRGLPRQLEAGSQVDGRQPCRQPGALIPA